MQTEADAHETAVRDPVSAPCGSGAGCTDHAVPSQRSANGRDPKYLADPTAVHALALVHEIETG
jgi:hypothetical protein